MHISKKSTALLLCLLSIPAFLLSGCKTLSKESMKDENAVTIEADTDITGTWCMPEQESTITFNEDLTFTTNDEKTYGNYSFMSQNVSFTIADLFDEIHYISCTDSKDDPFYAGAILGDLLSGYNEKASKERYYIREDRDPVALEDVLGKWQDINSNDYRIWLMEDGTVKTTDWTGTYTLTENETYGTTLTCSYDNYEENFALIRY